MTATYIELVATSSLPGDIPPGRRGSAPSGRSSAAGGSGPPGVPSPARPSRTGTLGSTALDNTHNQPRHIVGSALRAIGVFAETAFRVIVMGADGVR